MASINTKTPKEQILDETEIKRTLSRIAHEIVEKNAGVDDVVFVGILTRGVPLARRLARKIKTITDKKVEVCVLDIGLHRDDIQHPKTNKEKTKIPFNVTDKKVVLVDDVIYEGRTTRAAMDTLVHYGRPQSIQLAVLIDRGHRKLPIHPDYVGRTIPTGSRENVKVNLREVDGLDSVYILKMG